MYKKTGKLIAKDIVRGTSKAGKPWTKMTFVIDMTTDPKYPARVAFDTFKGDVIEFIEDTAENTSISVDFDVASREWNGKWFSNINAISAEVVRQEESPVVDLDGMSQTEAMHGKEYSRPSSSSELEEDDLPF